MLHKRGCVQESNKGNVVIGVTIIFTLSSSTCGTRIPYDYCNVNDRCCTVVVPVAGVIE